MFPAPPTPTRMPYPPTFAYPPTSVMLESLWAYSPSDLWLGALCVLALVLGFLLWRRYAREVSMQTMIAWAQFIWGFGWMVIADTWIAKRMRDQAPTPKQTRMTPLPPELQKPQPTEGSGFDWIVPALLAIVALIVLGLFGGAFALGWWAHAVWG